MFTGIIEEVATIRSHEGGELIIACELIRSDAALGDSIAVNGVDLTVRTIDADALRFDVMTETYRRANLGELKPGDAVNLERSVTGATRLSGHIVRGVVETTCTLDSFTPEGEAIIARYRAEPEFMKFIVMKGPVTLDGVSLTVMQRDSESFSVSLVQYTQEHTNLMRREPGDQVNLETDIFARYIDQLLEARAATT
ncbi:MAG: riboflavin synthase [Chloroflexi bacterium]|nr:riboflavin synthase [Chloroflexota bacterium]MDA1148311.1 riboflavin synthase [Chloroflexota bacterium]